MSAKSSVEIQIHHPDSRFQKEVIRQAIGFTHELPAPELGEMYSDLHGEKVIATIYFHAYGWYHITNVEADNYHDEDEFYRNLADAVRQNPHSFWPA